MNVWDRLARRVGVAIDALLGAVLAGLLAVSAAQLAGSWGSGYWQFDCAAGAVVSVLALVRRRHRGWPAVAGLAVAALTIPIARFAELPSEPGPALALGLAVLVGAAIRELPPVPAGTIAVAGAAVVAGTWFLPAHPSPAAVPVMTWLNGVAWLAALATGLCLRLLDTQRRATAEQVRRDERLELARELHDVVAHHITGIVIQAQAAQLVAGKHPERLSGSLAGIEAAGSDALAAMRRVVGLLRDADDVAPASPGPEKLSELVRRFDGHGQTVRLRMPDGEPGWPPEVTSTVYRVVQESLTNVARHAPQARSVTVSVAEDRRAITVEVVDDAPAAPARYHHRVGYGLVGMRERVETLGGTLRAGPRTGAGWSVHATLPVSVRGLR